MPDRSSKRPKLPRDTNQRAFQVVAKLTGQAADEPLAVFDVASSERQKNPAAVALGRLGGLKGGKARTAKLSAEKRQELARAAAAARWNKKT